MENIINKIPSPLWMMVKSLIGKHCIKFDAEARAVVISKDGQEVQKVLFSDIEGLINGK